MCYMLQTPPWWHIPKPLNKAEELWLYVVVSLQASVRLTLATLLYSGKSPDGHHILVNISATLKEVYVSRENSLISVTLHSLAFRHRLCVISEQCQVPTQGATCTDRPSHQGLPQFAVHHRLQPHHSASGKSTILKTHTAQEGTGHVAETIIRKWQLGNRTWESWWNFEWMKGEKKCFLGEDTERQSRKLHLKNTQHKTLATHVVYRTFWRLKGIFRRLPSSLGNR